MGVDLKLLSPFLSPVSVLGALMLYLSLLIFSNYYYRDRSKCPYLYRNGVALAAFAIGLFSGNVFGMPGLANTATTFFVLWCLEKYCELHTINNWNGWVLVL